MTTRKEAVEACLQLPFVYEDYPFDDNWTAIRHQANRKIFALIFEREHYIWINVKADPVQGDFWRQVFPAVVPGYHMNKQHWITILLDGSVSEAKTLDFLDMSYDLIDGADRKEEK